MGLFSRKPKHSEQDIKNARKDAQGYNIHVRSETKEIKPNKDGSISLWVNPDGSFFFGDNIDTVFNATKATFHIGESKEIVNVVSVPTGVTKTERTGRITGAAIGGVLLGPVGAAVGAAYGTGNTKSSEQYKIDYELNTISVPDYVELNIKSQSTGLLHTIQIEASKSTLMHLAERMGYKYEES